MSRGAVRPLLISGTGALQASAVIKATPGILEELIVTNTGAAVAYVQVFNLTAVPADATQPDLVFAVPAGSTGSLDLQHGLFFSVGISVCISSTAHTKTIKAAEAVFNAILCQY